MANALVGLWKSSKQLTVNVVSPIADLFSEKKSEVFSPPPVDVQAEWSKPFSSGSPMKKKVEQEAEEAEFSDFNYWRTAPPPPPEDEGPRPEDEYNEMAFWKAPAPTLAEIEAATGGRR